METTLSRGWVYPVTIWGIVLLTVLTTECAVMLILPSLLPDPHSRIFEAAVDALILTLVLAPVLWWTVVRPLREVIRLRTQFVSDLFEHMERDRRRTAHELHDGVGQSLTLLVSALRSIHGCQGRPGVACRAETMRRLAEDALREVKRLALGLRPSLLDDLGLAPALERLVADVRAYHPLDVFLDVTEVSGVRLPEPATTAIFRIIQEAVANIVKHSGARKVTIAVRQASGLVTAEVADDGCGIEPARLRCSPPGHLGLTGMRERAALLGGRFTIESTPGRGTRIVASIPVGGPNRG